MKYMYIIKNSPYIGIIITLAAYLVAVWIFKKSKNFFLFNPLLLATILCIMSLNWFNISYAQYNKGARILEFFLTPAIISLGFFVYTQWSKIQKQMLYIITTVVIGCFITVITSYFIAIFTHLGQFKLSILNQNSFLSTALYQSKILKGSAVFTTLFVILNALISYGLAPYIFKMLKITNPYIKGVTMGVTFNVYGALKSVEEGEEMIAITTLAFICSTIAIIYVTPLALKFIYWLI